MKYFLVMLLVISPILARPVSYPGGWTVMQFRDWSRSRVHIHYSPNFKNSYGISAEKSNENDEYNINFQWNSLIGRRNTKKSQANLYFKKELGVVFRSDEKEPHFGLALAGDFETRRYFIGYEAKFSFFNKLDNGSFQQYARLGIAPYVAEYGNIHTWLMLQIDHIPEENNNQVIVSPIIRLFKGDYLVELGFSSNNKILFNFIIRY